jgi:ribosomal protein L11 methyltransferase
MRAYPALDLYWPARPDEAHVERVLAEIDDERPFAIEDDGAGVRVFFSDAQLRNRAAAKLTAMDAALRCEPVDVSDEDWAARSQAALLPLRVGRFVVARDRAAADAAASELGVRPGDLPLLIPPSTGFGTGHHASTRLCLRLAQGLSLDGLRVVDVGTGSGILAIAADRLGAREVVGIDCDPDALDAAAVSVAMNGAVRVVLTQSSIEDAAPVEPADVVFANLTGALLARAAPALRALVRPGGHLIASGIQQGEADGVIATLAAGRSRVAERLEEDEWVAVRITSSRR